MKISIKAGDGAETDDPRTRKRKCEVFVKNVPDDVVLFISDETHLHLPGKVWCSLWSIGIIVSRFFEKNNNKAFAVTSEHYFKMVKEIVYSCT